MMEETLRKMRKHGSQTIEVTQSLEAFAAINPALLSRLIYRLKKGERLPRGRYFVGKNQSPISNHRRGSLPLVSYFCHPVGSV